MILQNVLLAEDDPDIQKVVRMSLKFRGVAQVRLAVNGEECLRMVAEGRPDVILLDVMMPKLDGYETCRRLKANPDTAAIPVIFLTAKAQQFEVREGMNAGALGYLVKPFDPMGLHDQIVELMSKGASAGQS